jgi:hypothetical protein
MVTVGPTCCVLGCRQRDLNLVPPFWSEPEGELEPEEDPAVSGPRRREGVNPRRRGKAAHSAGQIGNGPGHCSGPIRGYEGSHFAELHQGGRTFPVSIPAMAALKFLLRDAMSLSVQPEHHVDRRCLLHARRAQADSAHAVLRLFPRKRAIEGFHCGPGWAHAAKQR